ncbi:hypothetical protein A2303_01940 [Candidatus Falkowbacteria bacterium RIFOXYB2_FULL_47_14]|uniref:L,D-TPase catalytic domain-containing protein n=1 Tax=Candidatus Falkowbacteria bacterium RIFOXYA2_FULL_47_19 TaxID=1797994 RepID=A0A1F5SND9_9BACT|nr:MAG: hypothetical protein A2227_06750 [Candidatus Falkowbacteria bacterium RIFOXYA2_FULL_47_19]OGF43213.1 MAG: hypothetical protein A2303_01940 [Candidatus Falkowbacteria bacterium RIFOXYB2_FULL_47_14]
MKIKIILCLSLGFLFLAAGQARAEGLGRELAGRLLLQAEKNGEVWYVEPLTLKRYYLPQPQAILNEYHIRPLGISEADLSKIEAGSDPEFKLEPPRVFAQSRGWWGHVIAQKAAVKSAPDLKASNLGYLYLGDRVKVLAKTKNDQGGWYKIDGGRYAGGLVQTHNVMPYFEQPAPAAEIKAPPGVGKDEYWIDVDLSRKVLTLIKGENPEFVTWFSPGLANYPTRTGVFRIYRKYAKKTMAGGPPLFGDSFYLPDVPYTMYYSGSFAIHGTYWHDRFGFAKSHGCTNLTRGDAEYVFSKVSEGTLVSNHL